MLTIGTVSEDCLLRANQIGDTRFGRHETVSAKGSMGLLVL